MTTLQLGPQTCGELTEAARREWLVADGCGGYAMGTVAGLRTRRYHGLQVVSIGPIGRRCLGLAALDLVVEGTSGASDAVRLAVHEWRGPVLDPRGHELLAAFSIVDGVPTWRWSFGGVVLERELAMARGRPAVGIVHRLVAAPGPVRLSLPALCTWRDAHGERFGDGPPGQTGVADGFVFESSYRVRGPGFAPVGEWYRGVYYREEAARGLPETEDLWCAGTFAAELAPGEAVGIEAWAGDLDADPGPAERLVVAARRRSGGLVRAARAQDETDALLALAADQLVVETTDGPAVVAGYPWFGEWSRDTLTSYEGLFLDTGRAEEGRRLLERTVGLLSGGLLPNTADTGEVEDNTADAALWLLHAVGRHVERTGDDDLAAALTAGLEHVVDGYLAGARHHIGVDPADGLVTQGEPGLALTWMDARVDGRPVTRRAGKAVEVNALWVDGLESLARLQGRLGRPDDRARSLAATARSSFLRRFPSGSGLYDVVDGDPAEERQLRPNQLLAVSLPHGPLRGRPEAAAVVEVVRSSLLTPLGLRSLAPFDPAFVPRHRGDARCRDLAYHQGTVWPWLIGAYVEACLSTGVSPGGALDGLSGHVAEWGLGSVSETADGAAPHRASGCPFQAWSVAELLRARRLVADHPPVADHPLP